MLSKICTIFRGAVVHVLSTRNSMINKKNNI